jgi:hydrogenase expression/formation protein HypE
MSFPGACPIPSSNDEKILLAHGGGGRLTQSLLERLFFPAFENPLLGQRHDSAVLPQSPHRLAFTTDTYVVTPLFFPGGDIGALAINGTVNDLAMAGARARWISAAFVIEEGFPLSVLREVVDSMQRAAAASDVQVVTGDTKIVDRGKADGLFITSAGVGLLEHELEIAPAAVRPGDAVILSGDIGRHGIAVMSVREGLQFESPIESDCAPLGGLIGELLRSGAAIHCLRDLTRGGLASAVNEIARTARVQIDLVERDIPISEAVQGACEILGLDPLYVANEGRFIAFVPAEHVEQSLAALRQHTLGRDACVIGHVVAGREGLVTLLSRIGATRILDLLSGEQLPRIC